MQRAHLTAAEFRALPRAEHGKPNRYRNVPTVVDGIRFDSRKEAARWGELKLLERAGEISRLERQVAIPIIVSGVRVCDYIADAVYHDHDGKLVVEDVKSPITRKDAVYRLKRKLIGAVHQIVVREI